MTTTDPVESLPKRILALILPCLICFSTPVLPQTTTPEMEEAERLKAIIRQYYTQQHKVEVNKVDGTSTPGKKPELAGAPYEAGQVLLSGAQGITALQHFSRVLADTSIPTQLRTLDIIFHTEVRREGTMLSSRAHSIKSPGKELYITQLSLQGGEAVVKVKDDSWTTILPLPDATNYLVILSTPRGQQAELHLIPVPELVATNWADIPSWLPPIGEMAQASPGS